MPIFEFVLAIAILFFWKVNARHKCHRWVGAKWPLFHNRYLTSVHSIKVQVPHIKLISRHASMKYRSSLIVLVIIV